ncbi:Uncharacterised protein [uncultured archaeon]|nr:Uncharacterised protein [uncultured archaeon]
MGLWTQANSRWWPEMITSTRSENAPAGLSQNAASQNPLADLSTALDDFGSLATKISEIKAQAFVREAEVLKAILEKLTPLVPLLSRNYEACYRRRLVILTKEERVKIEKNAGFYREHKLILYENGLLVKAHRHGEWSEEGQCPAWELTEEEELTPQAAIVMFGFSAIAEGLMKVLAETPSMLILKDEMEARLVALTKVLEALICTQ